MSVECVVPLAFAPPLSSQLAALVGAGATSSTPALCWRMNYPLDGEATGQT
eukprot:SAG22_NODE_18308_length_289_cov_1.010526_1_plen_50_part_01